LLSKLGRLAKDGELRITDNCDEARELYNMPPGTISTNPNGPTRKWVFRGLEQRGALNLKFLRSTMPKVPKELPPGDATAEFCKEVAKQQIEAYMSAASPEQMPAARQLRVWDKFILRRVLKACKKAGERHLGSCNTNQGFRL